MSEHVFLLPDLGEGLTEATIAEWQVQVGDTVAIDQPVVEVETAKAAVEVPIPFEGTVLVLHGAEGDVLKVGTPLITVGSAASSPSPDAYDQHRQEERAGSGNVLIGYGTNETTRKRRRRVQPSTTASAAAPAAVTRVISPIVRQLATTHGIDLSTLRPTGSGGVIRRADVEGAISQATAPPSSSGAATHQVIPLKGLRKTIADKLSASRQEIPDATTWVDVDATELLRARRMINTALADDERISLLALLARLALTALVQYPQLNSTVNTEREEITQHSHVHLGIAAQTPRGLVVPVIANADTLSTAGLARAIAETTALARDGKLPPTRLTGGTFTLNNYGVFGVDGSTAIINHPEAAILGIGRIIDKPWVVDGELMVRTCTQISLSFDHRVCDGGTAGGFLREFGDYIENPTAAMGRM